MIHNKRIPNPRVRIQIPNKRISCDFKENKVFLDDAPIGTLVEYGESFVVVELEHPLDYVTCSIEL